MTASWQDLVFTVGQLVFAAALIGIVRAPAPPPLETSLPYAVIVWAFMVDDIGLHLPLAAVTCALGAVMWTILAWQGWRNRALRRRLAARMVRHLEDDGGTYRAITPAPEGPIARTPEPPVDHETWQHFLDHTTRY